jgi:hypothetical protein
MPATRTPAAAKKTTPAAKAAATRTRKAAAPAPLVFQAEIKKETAGSIHFVETGDREEHVSGSIYLRKGALPEGVTPQKVRVTVEIIG